MMYQARAHIQGPDQHELKVRFQNDPVWYFKLREATLNGSLVDVTEDADTEVVLVLRTNPRASVDECPKIRCDWTEEPGVVLVSFPHSTLVGASTAFQLDVIRPKGRKTFAYGHIVKEDLL